MDPYSGLLECARYVSNPKQAPPPGKQGFLKALEDLNRGPSPYVDHRFETDPSKRPKMFSCQDASRFFAQKCDHFDVLQISKIYNFEVHQVERMSRKASLHARFIRVVNKVMNRRHRHEGNYDAYMEFMGRTMKKNSVAPSVPTMKPFTKAQKLFKYAAKKVVMARRLEQNPSGDPWNAFFCLAYGVAKPDNKGGFLKVLPNLTPAASEISSAPPNAGEFENFEKFEKDTPKSPTSADKPSIEPVQTQAQWTSGELNGSRKMGASTSKTKGAKQINKKTGISTRNMTLQLRKGAKTVVSEQAKENKKAKHDERKENFQCETVIRKLTITNARKMAVVANTSSGLPQIRGKEKEMEERAQRERSKIVRPQWRYVKATSSPDGRSSLPRLFYLPLIPKHKPPVDFTDFNTVFTNLL